MALLDTTDRYAEAFDSFRHSAFRFESLQTYDMDDERAEIESFLRGDITNVPSPGIKEWCEEISAAKELGRTYERVRRINFPLNDYTRFEIITGFRFSSDAGEVVRLLESEPPGIIPADVCDFWLFDDSLCFWLRYDNRGRFLGPEAVDAVGLSLCRELKRNLIATSVALRESKSWQTLFP